MSIILKQWAGSNITPEDDANLYHHLEPMSGVFVGCTVTKVGNHLLRIAAGRGFMCGRLFTVSQMDVDAVIASSGTVYGRVKVVIDKERVAGPITIETEVAQTEGGLPELIQEDINADGTVFEIALATYTANDAEISTLVDARTVIQSTLGTDRLSNGAVTADKLAASAVETAKIADEAVTTAKIKSKAVTRAKIGDAAVGEAQIGEGAVSKNKLAAAVKSSLDLADSALQSVPDTYRTAADQDIVDAGKVDKVTGKGLSTNDFTNEDKNNVDSIQTIAQRVTTIEGKESGWDGKSVVSGTNDGTNWTELTVNGMSKLIPQGGGSQHLYQHSVRFYSKVSDNSKYLYATAIILSDSNSNIDNNAFRNILNLKGDCMVFTESRFENPNANLVAPVTRIICSSGYIAAYYLENGEQNYMFDIIRTFVTSDNVIQLL